MTPEVNVTKQTSLPSYQPSQFWEDTLIRLIQVPSVSGSEAQVALALEEILQRQFPGAVVSRQSVAGDRWNVIMQRGDPQITLTSHIDVVPGGPVGRITTDAIYGRGACDAKGQIVAQLWGLQKAIEEGLSDYRCVYVVGEETGNDGARRLLDLPRTKYILNGEPTGNKFVRRGWGGAQFQMEAHGKEAHSSLGTADSAIHKLLSDLHRLMSNIPEGMDINIGTIRGGSASNIQAGYATCDVCARVRGSEAPLVQLLEASLRSSSWKYRGLPIPGIEFFVPEFALDRDVEVRFGSDASIYAQTYENVMLFGPGDIGLAHTDAESIPRRELENASLMIFHLLKSLR